MSAKRHVSARRDGVESFKTGLCMHTLLSSERAASGVLDTWVNRGHPLGIFTVLAEHATGEGWLESRAITRVLRGWPVIDQVTGEPADRLREALDQGHRRRKGRAQRSGFRSGFRPRGVPVLMGERDIGGPAAWTSTRSRCIRSPGMPKTATAKAVGVAFTASVAPSGRCGPMPSAWGSIPEPEASVALLVNSTRSAIQLASSAGGSDHHRHWMCTSFDNPDPQTGTLRGVEAPFGVGHQIGPSGSNQMSSSSGSGTGGAPSPASGEASA